MPRISLRAYEKQIEDLIEQNCLQEAITHCRHILMTFPKCISTYRILGKAFLEGKEYPEASDVFKRVLAVYPDDFIAHVGMSIVRENENDLDAAIWHMELAFDSQPSNITIQEELKRLFGRRDGSHPAKIRLTRGALVRMYARGELYPQAIAEIKSALVEDPKRLDLKVLLAKMNYLLGDTSESLRLCNQLILELPYCYEINKLLVALLPSSNKAETLPIYLERLKALNPYEEFVTAEIDETSVPENRVLIDTLEEVENSTEENPTWVKDMESKWEEPTNPDSLDWLPKVVPAVEIANEQSVPFAGPGTDIKAESKAQPTEAQAEPQEEQLPEWMRSAGWLPTEETKSALEPNQTNAFVDNTPATGAESAEIPDWLKSLAPEEPENQSSGAEPPAAPVFAPPTSEPVVSEVNKPETTPINETSENDETELPDWLRNFEVESESAEGTAAKNEVPDWLKSIQQSEQGISTSGSEEPTAEASTSEIASAAVPIENTPALSEASVSPEITTNGNTEALLQEPPSEEETPATETELPAWVRSVIEKASAENQTATASETSVTAENPEPITENPSVTAETSGPALSEESGDDLLSWLRELKPEQESNAEEDVPEENSETATTNEPLSFDDGSSLDRLQELTGNEPQSSALEPETVQPEIPTEPIEQPNESTDKETEPQPTPTKPEEAATQPISESVAEVESVPVAPNEINAEMALSEISQALQTDQPVKEIIAQLIEISRTHGDRYMTWQLLGDAYAKSEDFKNALRSYNKAEELLLKSQ